MNRFICILILFSFFAVSTTKAQTISGKVIDSRSKNTLPFVNIVYGGSGYGTTTNIDGEFRIKSKETTGFLVVSYLGYHTDTVYLSNLPSLDNIMVELTPKAYNLEEVVILPGVNPAERIIKKVIENRGINNPEKMESFSCTSYSKMIFTVEKDTQNIADSLKYIKTETEKDFEKNHLLIIESVNEKKFIQPDKYNEKVIASKVSGFNDPIFSLIATQVQSFSFYNEYFEIFDKLYLNPISKGSTRRYLFLLEDTLFNEKDDTIYVISFRPRKGKVFTGLKGFLHINTNKYAIQSVVAGPLEKDLGKTIRIRQNYEFVDDKQWFPKELITEIIFEDALSSSDTEDHDMVARGRTYISNINLNPGFDKKDFNQIELKFVEGANSKSEEYWAGIRHDPLSEVDIETYRLIDSVSKALKLDKKMSALEALMNGNIPYKCFNLPFNKIIDYNKYEGFRLGLGVMTNDKVSRYFSIGGYFGYGFKDKTYKYGGDLKLFLHKDSESTFHFSYSNDVKENGGYRFFEPVDFSSTEIYRKFMIENMDMVENYEASFSFLSLKYLRTRLFANQSYVETTDGYAFGAVPVNSTGNFTFNEIGIQLRYAYNEKYLQTLKARYPIPTNYPVVCANFIRGDELLDGEYEYTKIEAKISKTFKTKILGKSKITLVGGLADGEIPLTKLYNGHGSYGSFTLEAENSFGTMRMGEFYSDKFFSVFFKHDFGNILIKTEKFSPKFALVHNYGIGELGQKQNHYTTKPLRSFDKGFYECGILVNNLYNQSFLGYGIGVFYRYGPYSFSKTADNFAYKISFTVNL